MKKKTNTCAILPQGYVNPHTLCNNGVQRDMGHLDIPQDMITLISYIDRHHHVDPEE